MSNQRAGDDQIVQKREQFRVSIRREQNENFFKNKRQFNVKNNELELTEQQVKQWYFQLVDQNIQPTLKEISKYLSFNKIEITLKLIDKCELYPQLIQLFKNCELDHDILHPLITIFCNLHCYTVFDDFKFLSDTVLMQKLINVLQITPFPEIQQQIFFLLGNLLGMDDGSKARCLADYGFCKFLRDIWMNNLIYLDIENLKDFTWFLSNFFSYRAANIAGFTKQEVQLVIPIVMECICLENTDIKIYSLQTLKHLYEHCEAIITVLVKTIDIYPTLQKLTNCGNENVELNALQALMGLFLSTEDIPEKILIEKGILDLMVQLYIQPGKDYQNKIKKIIVWGFSNLCVMKDYESLRGIIQHSVLKYILIDGMMDEEIKLQWEILQLIQNLSRINENDLLKYVLMSKNIAEIILNTLRKEETPKEIIILCLQIVQNFALRIAKYGHEQSCNMAITIFNSHGLLQVLERLEYLEDQEISQIAIKIHENFYI